MNGLRGELKGPLVDEPELVGFMSSTGGNLTTIY